MAFDLVQYFIEQTEIQKPALFSQLDKVERRNILTELNVLTLGKLISQWRTRTQEIYHEILNPDDLFIREIARHITTSPHNASTLSKSEQEAAITEIAALQLQELKQLHDTASLNLQGINELLIGQINYLSGQAEDWVWSTNNLIELKGSKPTIEDTVSLQDTLKEFNQMANQHHDTTDQDIQVAAPVVPAWAKIAEPVVALVILWVLASELCKVFA